MTRTDRSTRGIVGIARETENNEESGDGIDEPRRGERRTAIEEEIFTRTRPGPGLVNVNKRGFVGKFKFRNYATITAGVSGPRQRRLVRFS